MKPQDIIERWGGEPERYVREALRVEHISKQQREGLAALRLLVGAKRKKWWGTPLSDAEQEVVDKQGISIMSGKGTGKDAFAAWAILWFLSCFPYPKIPCTAPTQHQLRDVLWGEIGKWMRHSMREHQRIGSDFRLEDWVTWQSDRLFFTERGGREWFAVARTANPRASIEEQQETLAGFHEDYLMVVADEAASIPDPVFSQLSDTLTRPVNFALIIFNPTRRSGFALDTQQRQRSRWICFRWNAEESELVSRESIQEKAQKYGTDSNAYRVTVLGLPPSADTDAVIPWDWVIECVDRDDLLPLDTDPIIDALDVGAGGDPSIYLRRHGPIVRPLKVFTTDDSERLTNWALREILDGDPFMVFVDAIGIGWGIAGNLRARSGARVIDVKVSEVPANNTRFHRLRDELWWSVRERFEERNISIPRDDELLAELTTPKYEELGGKVKVEGKRELLRRACASPNRADALCLTEYYRATDLRRMLRRPSVKRKASSWKTI